MFKIKYLTILVMLVVVAVSALTACSSTSTTTANLNMYIGGTFALTGAYAEDTTAVLNGFQDYAKYVNDNHIIAPWYKDRTVPKNVYYPGALGRRQTSR